MQIGAGPNVGWVKRSSHVAWVYLGRRAQKIAPSVNKEEKKKSKSSHSTTSEQTNDRNVFIKWERRAEMEKPKAQQGKISQNPAKAIFHWFSGGAATHIQSYKNVQAMF